MSGDDSRFVETVVNDRSAIITVSAGSTPGGCLEHRAGFGIDTTCSVGCCQDKARLI